jgi:hypothetical protein
MIKQVALELNQATASKRDLFQKLTVALGSEMESEGSLPFSQTLTNGPYPEPAESSPDLHSLSR